MQGSHEQALSGITGRMTPKFMSLRMSILAPFLGAAVLAAMLITCQAERQRVLAEKFPVLSLLMALAPTAYRGGSRRAVYSTTPMQQVFSCNSHMGIRATGMDMAQACRFRRLRDSY